MTYDALFTHPTNDYYLVDLFTTALDDTLSRGKMSVNQTGLAAWSAVAERCGRADDTAPGMFIPAGRRLSAGLAPRRW